MSWATTVGIAWRRTQSRIDKTARRSYRCKTTPRSNVFEVSQVEVNRHVAAVATRLHDRLADVTADIYATLEDQIADLPRDARIMEVLGASIEGNVETMLHALRCDIAVERVEAPTAALEYARRLAQHGVPVNALVRAYRLGQRRMNELIFAE